MPEGRRGIPEDSVLINDSNRPGLKHFPRILRPHLENSPNRHKIAANSFWLFADKAIRMVMGLAVGVWVARYLGPEKFGLLSYAIAFGSLFAALANLGLESIAVREVVKNGEDTDTILGTTFILQLLSGLGAWVLVILAAAVFPLREKAAFWLILIISSAFLFQAFNAVDLYFRARVESRYSVMARIAPFFIASGIKVGLIVGGFPLVTFAMAIALEALLNAVGLLITYRRVGRNYFAWRFNRFRAKSLLAESWPLMISGLSIMVYMRIDQIMLAFMESTRMVGLYSAAVRISEVWYFVPALFVQSAFPIVVASRETDRNLYLGRLQNMFTLMSVLSYIIIVPLFITAGWLIPLLYGVQYSQASGVVMIHVWAGLFVAMGTVQSSWIISEGMTRLSLYRALLGAFSNVLLNLLLIPSMGIMGAAVATVISYGISACFSNFLFPVTRPILRMQMKGLLGVFEKAH
jgi:PST family polysaccharide transporter